MENLDKTIECAFQALLTIEEVKDHIMECLGLEPKDHTGATPTTESTKIDGRIHRLDGITTRIQSVHDDLTEVLSELDKI